MLMRTGQGATKIESVEGTPESLTAAEAQGKFKEISHGYRVNSYKRGLMRNSLSKDPPVKGSRLLSVKFVEEMVGGGASTEAPWGVRLRGCGFQKVGLKVMTIGTITGAGGFTIGDRIGDNATEGSATKTGVVVGIYASNTKLVFVAGTGTFADTDTVYNYSATANAPVDSAPSAAGWRYSPMTETDSQTPPSVTAEHRHGGERNTITAARGKASITMKMDEPALLTTEFEGCPVLDANTRPNAASAFTGITAVGGQPLCAKGMPVRIGTVTPVLTSIEIVIDNTLAARGTIADNEVESSGYIGVRITDRDVNAKIDPEYVVGTTLDVVARTLAGGTFRFTAPVGSVSHTNGLVIVNIPLAQLGDEKSPGDRDGIVTTDWDMGANVTVEDDEITIDHVFVA